MLMYLVWPHSPWTGHTCNALGRKTRYLILRGVPLWSSSRDLSTWPILLSLVISRLTFCSLRNATLGTLLNRQHPIPALPRISDDAHTQDLRQYYTADLDKLTHLSMHDVQSNYMQSSSSGPSGPSQTLLKVDSLPHQTPPTWSETQDDPIEELSRRMTMARLYGSPYGLLSPTQPMRKMVRSEERRVGKECPV